jgi:DNA-binding beta-propeller fold protein YncE
VRSAQCVFLLAAAGVVAGCSSAWRSSGAAAPPSAAPPRTSYLAYVVSEAADALAVIQFDSQGARVIRRRNVGVKPADIDGPHGVALSPDGRFYYITLGHGSPYGSLWKYDVATDSAVGHVMLGSFPASVSLTPDGSFAYVANFNLHGGMAASSVSIVATEAMLEVGRVATCMMPHGSRVDARGERHYSVCMMDNQLVEIDARRLELSRKLDLGATCSPTWVEPSATRAWVACNGSNELLEVDLAAWKIGRRLAAGSGIYNLAVTSDGLRVVATNRGGQSVSVIDALSGRELGRISTRRPMVHGVALSGNDRFAFVSVEGVGAEPGTVEIIDLVTLSRVASVDVAAQAAGIVVVRPR